MNEEPVEDLHQICPTHVVHKNDTFNKRKNEWKMSWILNKCCKVHDRCILNAIQQPDPLWTHTEQSNKNWNNY